MPEHPIAVGGVAARINTAKARRVNQSLEIVVYEFCLNCTRHASHVYTSFALVLCI